MAQREPLIPARTQAPRHGLGMTSQSAAASSSSSGGAEGVSLNPLNFNDALPEINARAMTPVSIEACAELGVDPNALLARPPAFFASLPEMRGRPPEAAQAAARLYELARGSLLAQVQAAHGRILRRNNEQLARTAGPAAGSSARARPLSPQSRAQAAIREGRRALDRREAKVKEEVREALLAAAQQARAKREEAALAARLRAEEEALRVEHRRQLMAKARDPMLRQVVVKESAHDPLGGTGGAASSSSSGQAPRSLPGARGAMAASAPVQPSSARASALERREHTAALHEGSPRRAREAGVESLLAEHRLRQLAIAREEQTEFRRAELDRRVLEARILAAETQAAREQQWRDKMAALEARHAEREERKRVEVARFGTALEAKERMARERHDALVRKRDNYRELRHVVVEERARIAALHRQENEAERADKGRKKKTQVRSRDAAYERTRARYEAELEARQRDIEARDAEAARRLEELKAQQQAGFEQQRAAEEEKRQHREHVLAAGRQAELDRLEAQRQRKAEADARRDDMHARRDYERSVRAAEAEFKSTLRREQVERAKAAAAYKQAKLRAEHEAEEAAAREERLAAAHAEQQLARISQAAEARMARLREAAARVAACDDIAALNDAVLEDVDKLSPGTLVAVEAQLKARPAGHGGSRSNLHHHHHQHQHLNQQQAGSQRKEEDTAATHHQSAAATPTAASATTSTSTSTSTGGGASTSRRAAPSDGYSPTPGFGTEIYPELPWGATGMYAFGSKGTAGAAAAQSDAPEDAYLAAIERKDNKAGAAHAPAAGSKAATYMSSFLAGRATHGPAAQHSAAGGAQPAAGVQARRTATVLPPISPKRP